MVTAEHNHVLLSGKVVGVKKKHFILQNKNSKIKVSSATLSSSTRDKLRVGYMAVVEGHLVVNRLKLLLVASNVHLYKTKEVFVEEV